MSSYVLGEEPYYCECKIIAPNIITICNDQCKKCIEMKTTKQAIEDFEREQLKIFADNVIKKKLEFDNRNIGNYKPAFLDKKQYYKIPKKEMGPIKYYLFRIKNIFK